MIGIEMTIDRVDGDMPKPRRASGALMKAGRRTSRSVHTGGRMHTGRWNHPTYFAPSRRPQEKLAKTLDTKCRRPAA